MSFDTIRTALGALISDPHDAAAWKRVEEVVAAGGGEPLARELERARVEHEKQHSWEAATRLLGFEAKLARGPAAASKQLLRARILREELCQDDEALAAYRTALAARPDDARVKAAIGDILAQRDRWQAIVSQAVSDAGATRDGNRRARLLVTAAEATLRHAPRDESSLGEVASLLERAIAAEPGNRRALGLAALVFEALERWDDAADVLTRLAKVVPVRGDKVASAARVARIRRSHASDEQEAIRAHEALLEVDPGNAAAVAFLRDVYTQREDWPALVAFYERRLGSGAVKASEEFGLWVQLAMLNWQSIGDLEAAAAYFERVRRADPTHAGMLRFFRERHATGEAASQLLPILSDAQRATSDEPLKRRLAQEIATLAEGQENSRHAVEQYKTILRSNPNDAVTREKLKQLYREGQSYNALVDLLRQDLQRAQRNDSAARLAVLREMAEVYRDLQRSDTALLTVLTQVVQLDPGDVEAARELTRVYEALGRWRDLLGAQQRLAEITDDVDERVELLRSVARRWLEQFSNVQNALAAYEALFHARPGDDEAREQLVDLYQKRRAWPKLFDLYEAQLGTAFGDDRLVLKREMAKIAAERLDRGAEAVQLLREVYDEAPYTEGVLDLLEKQAERLKDFHTVAFVFEARIEEASDDDKVVLLQKLGALQAEKLADPAAANATWRRVLDLAPGHPRALRILRQSLVDARDWDGLEDLYGSQDDWDGLADFLSTTADRTTAGRDKVELSFRAARIYEHNLGAPERALRSYERILSVEPGNLDAVSSLIPLYEQEGKWARLPGLLSVLLEATDDVDEQVATLGRMAEIAGTRLSNRHAALQYARRAYDLRRDDEGLETLRTWSERAGDWEPFVEVLQARIEEGFIDEVHEREVKARLADVYAQHLDRVEEAIELYRGLVEADPHDEPVVTAFDQLLRATGSGEELRWLFELKATRFQGQERVQALEEWAQVEQDVFGDPERAIELLERVLAEDTTRTGSLAELTALLLEAGNHARAAEVMLAHRDEESGAARLRLETDLAVLYLENLGAPELAFDACQRALELDPDNEGAIAILDALTAPLDEDVAPEPGAVRARAAEVLEQHHLRTGHPSERIRALRVLLEHEQDASRRLDLCRWLADALENDLNDDRAAFDVVLNTLREAPAEVELWDRAERLAGRTGRPTDLAAAYRQHLAVEPAADQAPTKTRKKGRTPTAEDAIPVPLRIELCERAANLHEEQLGDPEGAIPYLEQIVGLDRHHDRAFSRLRDLLSSAERWLDLEALHRRAAETADDDGSRIEHLQQAAVVAEELLADDGKAIGYLERVVELDPLHADALDALERLYERDGRHDDLARLLERRLETFSDEEGVAARVRLVELYVHAIGQHDRVMDHLVAVLDVDRDHDGARRLAEACLAIEALRQPTAALLDGVYEARDEARDLARILDIRLEGAASDDERRELLRRLAAVLEDRLKDDARSFEALRRLLPLDAEDVEVRDRLLAVGQRVERFDAMAEALAEAATRCGVAQSQAELLMAAARVCRYELEDDARAEAHLRQAMVADPDDSAMVLPAARMLGEILQARGDHAGLAAALAVQVTHGSDRADRARLLEQIADLHEELLDDPAGAIAAWKSRLEEDDSDRDALAALERLYGVTEQWRDLLDVLQRTEQSAPDADERKRCLVRTAEVLGSDLGEVAEAIAAWRTVLDDFGPDAAALEPLTTLYERAERFEDLAEALESWLSIGEADTVDLQVRLGDVRRLHLGDPTGAMAAYRDVLEREPDHLLAREALDSLLQHEGPEVRTEAAGILIPILRAEGQAEALVAVLDIAIEATDDPTTRLEFLDQALATAEESLERPSLAFDYACRAVREALGDGSLADRVAEAERLAGATARQADLLALYEASIDEMLDSDLQHASRLRAGELARHAIGDDARAVGHYRAALDARGDDVDAMVALETLYEALGDEPHLLDILLLRAEHADDHDRVAFLLRAAQLQAGPLDDPAAAIRTYEEILPLSFHSEAVVALEALYRSERQFDALVELLERRIESADGGEAAEVRAQLADVLLDPMGDVDRALEELDAALALEAAQPHAVATLEHMLATITDSAHRAHVARSLEPVYRAAAEWNRLREVLEVRIDTAEDAEERCTLLDRLARHFEEQVEDYPMALETLARRLQVEPGDDRVWDRIEALGVLVGDDAEERVGRIFATALDEVASDDPGTARLCHRTGELFALAGHHEEGLRWYRRAYAFDPDSTALFEAIDALLVILERPEERIDLYRGAIEGVSDGDRRVVLLHVVASLQRGLDDIDEAIETLREILEVAPADDLALDALTELYEANGREDDLAELYERRADLHEDPAHAAVYRLALARLLTTREEERDRAIEQLERILDALPTHEDAIAELERLLSDPGRKERVIEVLQRVHETNDDWARLIELNEHRLTLHDDPMDRVAILLESASLWEERGEDADKAFAVVRTAFALVPDHDEARTRLEQLADATGSWGELAAAYESAAAGLEDALTRGALLSAVADLCDQRLADPSRGLAALVQVSALDPSNDDVGTRIDDLCVSLEDWETLADVLANRADHVDDATTKAQLLERLGEVRQDRLGDEEAAIEALDLAIDLDPHSTVALDRLIALQASRDPARHVALLEQRIEATHDDDSTRLELCRRAADVYARDLERVSDGIRMLEQARDVAPTDESVLVGLDRLYEADERWHDLLDNLRTQAELADGAESRSALRNRMGDIHLERLGQPSDALDRYREVLDEISDDAHAIGALHDLAREHADLRVEIASMLEPIYEAAGRVEERIDMMELRIAAQDEPAERAAALLTIASLQEEWLEAPEHALETLLRALPDLHADGASADPAIHDRIEALCAATGDWSSYAASLDTLAAEVYDGAAQSELLGRLGRLAEGPLEDSTRAIEAYRKAADQADDPAPFLEALDRLLVAASDLEALALVIERRIEVVGDDGGRSELHHRLAEILLAHGDDASGAIDQLERCLELAPDHEEARVLLEHLLEDPERFERVSEILEGLYVSNGDVAARVRLREKRIAFTSDASERVRLLLELARLLEDEGDDRVAAQSVLERALPDNPVDEEVLAGIERLAAANGEAGEGAAAWSRAVEAVSSALGAALEAAQTGRGEGVPTELARDVFLRLGTWCEEQLGDAAAAEQVVASALELDPECGDALLRLEVLLRAEGRERELVDVLRRLAQLIETGGVSTDREAADVRREAKMLAEDVLEDVDRVELVLREMLEASQDDAWALSELAGICARRGSHEERFSLLKRLIEIGADGDDLTRLRHETAAVAEDHLGDVAAAIEIHEQAFEADPNDAEAAAALDRLYEAEGRDEDRLRLLERLIDREDDPEARAELRVRSAALALEKFEAQDDAIDHLKAALDDAPENDRVVERLSDLLDKAGRDDELVELVQRQLDIAGDRGDRDSERHLRRRLAELCDERLGDPDRAVDAYLAVLEGDPGDRAALESLARLYEVQGRNADAAETYEKLLEGASDEAAGGLALKALDLVADDDDAAVRILDTVLAVEGLPAAERRALRQALESIYLKFEKWSDLADLLVLRAEETADALEQAELNRRAADLRLSRCDDVVGATHLLEKAHALQPSDREVILQLADVYAAGGQADAALEMLEKAVHALAGKRTREVAELHERIAHARLAKGEVNAAIQELEAARRIEPANVAVAATLGRLSLEQHDATEDAASSVEHLKRAEAIYKALLLQKLEDGAALTKAEVFFGMAQVLVRQNDPKKAIHNLERALAADPAFAPAEELLRTLRP